MLGTTILGNPYIKIGAFEFLVSYLKWASKRTKFCQRCPFLVRWPLVQKKRHPVMLWDCNKQELLILTTVNNSRFFFHRAASNDQDVGNMDVYSRWMFGSFIWYQVSRVHPWEEKFAPVTEADQWRIRSSYYHAWVENGMSPIFVSSKKI